MHNIENAIFFVGNEPYCVWSPNIRKENISFLNSIEPEYFEYQANVHLQSVEKDESKSAAIALRISYHHGLETLFTLLGALMQAPNHVPGWILKSMPNTIRDICSDILRGRLTFPHVFRDSNPNLKSISELLYHNVNLDEDLKIRLVESTANMLRRLMQDFTQEHHIREYNSIKHGLRARPGGVRVAFAPQKEPGERPPDDRFQWLNDDKYGLSFPIAVEPKVYPSSDKKVLKHHFHLSDMSVNWSPRNTAFALCATSMMIGNMVSRLMIINGAMPDACKFNYLPDPGDYNKPWDEEVTMPHSTFGNVLHIPMGNLLSKDDLIKLYNDKRNTKLEEKR